MSHLGCARQDVERLGVGKETVCGKGRASSDKKQLRANDLSPVVGLRARSEHRSWSKCSEDGRDYLSLKYPSFAPI